MVIEGVTIGVLGNLAYDVLKRGKDGVVEKQFFHDSVREAVDTIAEQYEISPQGMKAIFTEVLDVDTVEQFHQQDQEEVFAELATALVEEADENVDGERIARDFFKYFKQNLARHPSQGGPLLISYLQQLSEDHPQSSELQDQIDNLQKNIEQGQEEILQEIKDIEYSPISKGHEIFQPTSKHFSEQLNGEDPNNRYDLPFFGRNDDLDTITEFPESEKDVLILTGQAGIGKTRLVVESGQLIESENTDWKIYWTDVHAENIDEGLEKLELGKKRNTILFVDDARNADQIRRLFDLANQYQSQLKLIFTERPHFIASLRAHANRSLKMNVIQLQPLNSDDIHNILQEYYGITQPQILEWIVGISEGIPLIVHLLAKQFSADEQLADPTAQAESLGEVFDDILFDIQRLADQQGTEESQELETYIEYLSAIGEVDTNNEEQLQRFRDTISVDKTTEEGLRKTLTKKIGFVVEQGDRLTVQPDALQEYIVYDSFFSDSPRNYQKEIYKNFKEYTGKIQINQLAIIHHRYECRDARKAIRKALYTELDKIDEYGLVKRVQLLRQFKTLGSAHPLYAIELAKTVLQRELPNDPEEGGLARSSLYTNSPAGDLLIESINLLSNTLHGEPEAASEWLLWIAVTYPQQSQLQTGSVKQKLRQEMRPGFKKSPAVQQKILNVVEEFFLSGELGNQLKLDLLDIIGEVANIEIHDFSVDPIDHRQMRTWQGVVPVTESWLELRSQALELLIEIIQEEQHIEIQKTATEKLISFDNAQIRYYSKHQEIFSREELISILEFAIEYITEDENLQCIAILGRLANRENADELGIEEEIRRLEVALENNERYQILQKMRYKHPQKIEEIEAEIRDFAGGIDKNELGPSDFADIVSEFTDRPFGRFFTILADERPEYGEQIMQEDDQDMKSYQRHVIVGICNANPSKGKKLVDQYIDEDRFELVSAGLGALASHDIDYVQNEVDRLLDNLSKITPELVSYLSRVVHGYWEDDQEWTESVLLRLLQDAESLDSQSVDAVLLPLPFHKDDSRNIDVEILNEVLDYVEKKENLTSESNSIRYVIAEIAERDPEQFVEFTLQRLANEYTGVSLLPTHLDIGTDRMKEADSYNNALNKVCERILDTDYYAPMFFSDLTGCFPIADITEHLLPKIPDCSEEQLLHVIWYCKFLSVTDETEKIYRTVVTEGVDDIQEAESVRNVISSALYTDAHPTINMSGESKKEDEINMLRDWQEDPTLPFSVRLFAEEMEDELLDSIGYQEERIRGREERSIE